MEESVMMFFARVVAVGVAIAGLSGTLRAGQSADAEKLRGQLVGAYKLVSYVNYDQSGKPTPAPFTIGQISYDKAGRMSAQLMRPDRQKFAANPPTDAERATAYSGFISYFGRYEIDPVKRTVTHHVEGSMSPGTVGAMLVRYFEFSPDGGSLFLSVKDGERVTGKLQWDRYR
jgi:hypothetical protein